MQGFCSSEKKKQGLEGLGLPRGGVKVQKDAEYS